MELTNVYQFRSWHKWDERINATPKRNIKYTHIKSNFVISGPILKIKTVLEMLFHYAFE